MFIIPKHFPPKIINPTFSFSIKQQYQNIIKFFSFSQLNKQFRKVSYCHNNDIVKMRKADLVRRLIGLDQQVIKGRLLYLKQQSDLIRKIKQQQQKRQPQYRSQLQKQQRQRKSQDLENQKHPVQNKYNTNQNEQGVNKNQKDLHLNQKDKNLNQQQINRTKKPQSTHNQQPPTPTLSMHPFHYNLSILLPSKSINTLNAQHLTYHRILQKCFNSYIKQKTKNKKINNDMKVGFQYLGKVRFVNRLFGTREQVAAGDKMELVVKVVKRGKVDQAIKNRLRAIKKSIFKQQSSGFYKTNQSFDQKNLNVWFDNPFLPQYRQRFQELIKRLSLLFNGWLSYLSYLSTSPLSQFSYNLIFQKDFSTQPMLQKLNQQFIQCEQQFKRNLLGLTVKKLLTLIQLAQASMTKGGEQERDEEKEYVQSITTGKLQIAKAKFYFALIQYAFSIVFKQIEQYGQLSEKTMLTKRKHLINNLLKKTCSFYRNFQNYFKFIEPEHILQMQMLAVLLQKYHVLRLHLRNYVTKMENYLRLFDSSFDQKLELGLLSNMLTQYNLSDDQFFMKLHPRFSSDIIEHLIILMRDSHVQLSVNNKRKIIISMLQKFLRVYTQTDLLSLIQPQFIYILCKYLQKQLYLHQKTSLLFTSRTHLPNQPCPSSSIYFIGKPIQLLSQNLLFYLISIVKYKHQKGDLRIQQIDGYNLVQEWYVQAEIVRLGFFRQQVLERYKRLKEVR